MKWRIRECAFGGYEAEKGIPNDNPFIKSDFIVYESAHQQRYTLWLKSPSFKVCALPQRYLTTVNRRCTRRV